MNIRYKELNGNYISFWLTGRVEIAALYESLITITLGDSVYAMNGQTINMSNRTLVADTNNWSG